MKNIFIYGLSGAGKDTISNYLRDNFGYLKLRIAGTIKQYVFETYGFKTQEEFEKSKRINQDVRKAHNIFGEQYDNEGIARSSKEATTNRIDSLINKTALEFEISKDMINSPICIVDVRTRFEAERLLNAGFYGIFLTRKNKSEFVDNQHKTEQNIYMNYEFKQLCDSHINNIILIDNYEETDYKLFCEYIKSEYVGITTDRFTDVESMLTFIGNFIKTI